MSKAKFLSASKSDGFGFCSVVFGWDSESAVTSEDSNISTTCISLPISVNNHPYLQSSLQSHLPRMFPIVPPDNPVSRSNSHTSVHDQTYSRELLVSNRANGYRDLIALIDLSSYRRLPWEKNIPFFFVRFVVPETGKPLDVDPRGVLGEVKARAEDKGWKCLAGAEFEVGQRCQARCRVRAW
jgi:hypothetical protein